MAGGRARRWMILVATVWIQAFTGTNFDFSAYSSALKAAMGISQVQLSYLATASDLGKALGWSSGLALLYLPLPAVLLIAAALGLAGYAAQWLLITGRISLPYIPVFLLCLLAGCSICWFNTVCFLLCNKNFTANRSLALSLTVSFNGVSAAVFTLVANALDGGSSSVYLLLNATLPLLASAAALLPILRQPSEPVQVTIRHPVARRDSHIFLLLNALAFVTGLYLLFLNPVSSVASTARYFLVGAIVLLLLPLCIPGVICAQDWARRTIYFDDHLDIGDERTDANDVNVEDPDLHKGLVAREDAINGESNEITMLEARGISSSWWWCYCCDGMMEMDRLVVLGEEHSVKRLVRRIDFWMYYVAYFCGATIGLVYSNNLGQIAQSLGRESNTAMLVTVSSSCSFFGRLLSSVPDFLRGTGWLAIALVPTPLALFLLAAVGDGHALLAGTALIGLSSGFIFAAAVSVTSELFGPNSVGVNHNILITNIPLGSLLYGLLGALVYDANGKVVDLEAFNGDGAVVCMGRMCYAETFQTWGYISLLGLASSTILYLRTRSAYEQSERRRSTHIDVDSLR